MVNEPSQRTLNKAHHVTNIKLIFNIMRKTTADVHSERLTFNVLTRKQFVAAKRLPVVLTVGKV